jgi:hypothetical protein
VYAASAVDASAFAERQGWRPAGHAGWQTKDGMTVLFLCFIEQLEAVTAGAVVFDAGMCAEARRMLKQRRATIR